jgi:hypothetical protein
MRLIDLSHTVTAGMVTYPGLPGPEIPDHLSFEDSHAVYAEGTEFTMGRIDMVSNTRPTERKDREFAQVRDGAAPVGGEQLELRPRSRTSRLCVGPRPPKS